jgi:hypothetical protein
MMSFSDEKKVTYVTSKAFKQTHGTTVDTQEDRVFNFLKGFTKYNKENSAATRQCRQVLANFLRAAANDVDAFWFPIISKASNSLAVLLGLDYQQRYLPLMVTCGLVKVSKSKGKLLLTIPYSSANNRYSWEAFMAEFHLSEAEITKSFINEYGGHVYCIKVGRFTKESFNPVEQFCQKWKLPKLLHLEPLQRGLVVSLAPILPLMLPLTNNEEDEPESTIISDSIEGTAVDVSNLEMLLSVHFFDRIMKPGCNIGGVWKKVDKK